jgi:acetyl/propionyl-CoA carboxylase alpha subunit
VSTTTKIFIVLVCLFAFLFTPMTIQFVARTHNWRKLAETYQDIALSSQVHNRNVIALTFAQKEELNDELEKIRATQRRWEDENTKLRQDLAQLNAAYATLDLDKVNLDTRNSLLAASVKVKSDENGVLTRNNSELRTRNDRLMTENVELNDRVKELSAQLLIREQKLRMQEEENLAIRQENERLRETGKVVPSTTPGPVGPAPKVEPMGPAATSPIRGKITDVQGNSAEVDVGAADGVKKGMVFVVMREGKYLGDLRIEVIEPRSSVGTLELTGQGEIKKGDDVRDKASMMEAAR